MTQMPSITFIEFDGTEKHVGAEADKSLMQIAVDNLVTGILADCGGACSCATCHAYIDSPWFERLAPKSEDEALMLQGVIDLQPNSRLTCQIKMRAELEGLVIRLPKSQG